MGIEHRDHSRERHHNVTSIRRQSPAWSTARISLVWGLVGVVLFAGIRFASRREAVEMPAPPRVAAAPTPHQAPVKPTQAALATPASPRRGADVSSSNPTPIYRCGNAYGAAPCANGRAIDGPAAAGFDSRPSVALANLVAQGRTPDVGTVTTVASTVTKVENGIAPDDGSRLATCRLLAGEIDGIDRAARQPQSIPRQDVLRTRRRIARDRQASLHC